MTESGDPLAQFIAECERRFRPEESRSFWDCTEAFAELAGSGFVVEHVNRELARCKREPGYLGSWMQFCFQAAWLQQRYPEAAGPDRLPTPD